MARLVIPPNFIHRTELFKKVLAKDTVDGATSVIRPFMDENEIVLSSDDTAVDAAIVIHNAFEQFEKDGEKKTKERNNLFDPVWENHTTMVQLLKKFYKNNIAKLGDWDVEVNGNKIVYPADFINRRLTVLAFIEKHNSYAAGESPLTSFLAEEENKVDIAQNQTDATDALAPHNDAKQFAQDAETKRQDRDNLMDPVTDHIEMIGNFLIGHYPKNPRKAGDWGYTVDTSPKADAVREGVINMGSPKKLNQLAVNSILLNTSAFPIEAFKGDAAEGTPIIIQPNIPFVIRRGWGITTLRNPSDTQKATYKGTFHR
jgi:hypothetical protein